MAEEKEKKDLIDWFKEHPKVTFGLRAAFWFLFAGVLPFVFIAWRYGIFTDSTLRLNGFGIIAILIAAIVIIVLANYIYQILEPGLFKNVMKGFVSIILPLLIFYILIYNISKNVEVFKQALGCTIICEAIAIPFNPFPELIEKRKAEKKLSFVDSAIDLFFKRKKEEEK